MHHALTNACIAIRWHKQVHLYACGNVPWKLLFSNRNEVTFGNMASSGGTVPVNCSSMQLRLCLQAKHAHLAVFPFVYVPSYN